LACGEVRERKGSGWKALSIRFPSTGSATISTRPWGNNFTFSVPKSVSLLYALTGDRELLDAFREAVDETMHDIESEMKTRVRKDGKDEERVTGNMTWAEFIHTTSRPVDGVPDPQLHAHCFVFNSTFDDQERQWKAGQFRDLKRDAPYFQAAFRVRLSLQNVTRAGNFEQGEQRHGTLLVSGVPFFGVAVGVAKGVADADLP
jgi:conjugative relaxase-like TrwC/TraI family protein